MIRSSKLTVLSFVGILSLGCEGDDDGAGDDFGSEENACELIEGETYLSQEEKDCGIGPKGEPATCHWRVTFDAGSFDWRYSDLILEGTYSCDGSMVTGTSPDTDEEIEGDLDPQTGELRWDGVMYEPET